MEQEVGAERFSMETLLIQPMPDDIANDHIARWVTWRIEEIEKDPTVAVNRFRDIQGVMKALADLIKRTSFIETPLLYERRRDVYLRMAKCLAAAREKLGRPQCKKCNGYVFLPVVQPVSSECICAFVDHDACI